MQNLFAGFIYFISSFLLTGWFILESPLYISNKQMFLSASIAGGKWLIQILSALAKKKSKSFVFIREIGLVCLIGSVALLPYCFSSLLNFSNHSVFFLVSLIIAVFLMIPLYYFAVKRTGFHISWWVGWMFCLVVAVSSQLTFVFNIF